jgi:hypothetical protein
MLRKLHGHEDAAAYTLYTFFVLALVTIMLYGCKSITPPVGTVIERATEAGTVAVELPSPATFERSGLPPGIEAKDVAAVITLMDQPKAGEVLFDKVTGAPIPASSKKSGKSSVTAKNQVLVLKDGRVIAGKAAAEQIATTEKIKPSYAWAWWILAALLALLAVAWAVRSFEPAAKVVASIIGIFRRG